MYILRYIHLLIYLIYVFKYVCMYVQTHTHIHIHVCLLFYTCIYVNMYVCELNTVLLFHVNFSKFDFFFCLTLCRNKIPFQPQLNPPSPSDALLRHTPAPSRERPGPPHPTRRGVLSSTERKKRRPSAIEPPGREREGRAPVSRSRSPNSR